MTTKSCFKKKLAYNYRMFGGDYHNEAELMNKIISPLFVFAEIPNQPFSFIYMNDIVKNII